MQTLDLAIVAPRKRRQYCFQLVSSSAGRAAEHLGDISFRRAVGKHPTALGCESWDLADEREGANAKDEMLEGFSTPMT